MMSDENAISTGLRGRFGDLVNPNARVDKQLRVGDFVPMPHHLLVRRLAPDEVTEGGIALPETGLEDKPFGFVVAVNPYEGSADIDVGDLVLIRPHAGRLVTIEDVDYVVCQHLDTGDGDIIGKWPREIVGEAVETGEPIGDPGLVKQAG